MVQFGKHAIGIYFFGQIGKSAPEAVIGRALDMASVAYFSRANGLMEIFNRSVLRAALPLCLPSVSYTHLDVYKRQWWNRSPRCSAWACGQTSSSGNREKPTPARERAPMTIPSDSTGWQ